MAKNNQAWYTDLSKVTYQSITWAQLRKYLGLTQETFKQLLSLAKSVGRKLDQKTLHDRSDGRIRSIREPVLKKLKFSKKQSIWASTQLRKNRYRELNLNCNQWSRQVYLLKQLLVEKTLAEAMSPVSKSKNPKMKLPPPSPESESEESGSEDASSGSESEDESDGEGASEDGSDGEESEDGSDDEAAEDVNGHDGEQEAIVIDKPQKKQSQRQARSRVKTPSSGSSTTHDAVQHIVLNTHPAIKVSGSQSGNTPPPDASPTTPADDHPKVDWPNALLLVNDENGQTLTYSSLARFLTAVVLGASLLRRSIQ